jgi:hypothetical protein
MVYYTRLSLLTAPPLLTARRAGGGGREVLRVVEINIKTLAPFYAPQHGGRQLAARLTHNGELPGR